MKCWESGSHVTDSGYRLGDLKLMRCGLREEAVGFGRVSSSMRNVVVVMRIIRVDLDMIIRLG